MLCIIDYGIVNLGSLKNTLNNENISFEVKTLPSELNKFSHAILPGVGNFKVASNKINEWKPFILKFLKNKNYLLGICLGMQLLFEFSEESNNQELKGLELIKGNVTKLPMSSKYKIPHMGWNNIKFKKKHPLFSGVNNKVDFYFAHSFFCKPKNQKIVYGETNYMIKIPSIIIDKNIIGFQFHPEKSYAHGSKLLKNFSNLK